MKTIEVTEKESELIQKSVRKHLIRKHKQTGELYEVNPLENVDWRKDTQEYYSYDQKDNVWIDGVEE